MKKPKYQPKITRAVQLAIAQAAVNGNLQPIRDFISTQPASGWVANFRKLLQAVESNVPAFTVFANGNSKLPFTAFSSAPLVDCGGAGACRSFCYSLTSWRYPAAFCRQLQNSLLLRTVEGRAAIAAKFDAIPAKKRVLRLYVDGDFASVEILRFWMELIRTRPSLSVYGYSKSWSEFIALDMSNFEWPANYLLNLSSGSKFAENVRERMNKIACVRGDFLALPVAKLHVSTRAYQSKRHAGFKSYAQNVRESARAAGIKRVFVCAGKCGECMPDGRHACGDARMIGVPIAIGVH